MPLQSYRGYVYLIGSGRYGWYKIGRSRTASIRIKNIGILLPFRVDVIAVWKTSDPHRLEKEMHEAWAPNHLNGEWFTFDGREILAVAHRISEFPSERIYFCGSQASCFCPSNLSQDREGGVSKLTKKVLEKAKKMAYRKAVEGWLRENGKEITKENFKAAKRLACHHDRYVMELKSLQYEEKALDS